eukprot:6738628-Prymnesium_polylepis.1
MPGMAAARAPIAVMSAELAAIVLTRPGGASSGWLALMPTARRLEHARRHCGLSTANASSARGATKPQDKMATTNMCGKESPRTFGNVCQARDETPPAIRT